MATWYLIRATGAHGRTATEPAGSDLMRADDLARRATGLRDVHKAEVLSPAGESLSTHRKEHDREDPRTPDRALLGAEKP